MKIRGTTVTTPLARHAVTDDTCVSQKPWSSKNTVDMLCPSFEESGAIVACEPVEGYPLTVTASAEATKIIRCGKNLWDFKSDVSEVIYYVSDGAARGKWGYEVKLPPGTYRIHAESVAESFTNKYIYCYIVDKDNNYIATQYIVANNTLQYPTVKIEEGQKLQISNAALDSTNPPDNSNKMFKNQFNIQIEKGNAYTPYEPYRGEDFAVGEEIPAISGVNYLYADNGEIEVNGRSDITAIINEIKNAVIAAGSGI
jgi:hypothetical protein